MPSTSGFHEPLVHCDVEELTVPEHDGELAALKGSSVAQTTFAANMRDKKTKEWRPDLPTNVFRAICGIADATWWLANQNNDSSNIGWPKSWYGASRNPSQPELGQPSPLRDKNSELLEGYGGKQPVVLKDIIPNGDIEQFDAFARKACQSPELSYMTMMALLYRQTKDSRVLAKFVDVRQKVGGHLDAIDHILGSPGE